MAVISTGDWTIWRRLQASKWQELRYSKTPHWTSILQSTTRYINKPNQTCKSKRLQCTRIGFANIVLVVFVTYEVIRLQFSAKSSPTKRPLEASSCAAHIWDSSAQLKTKAAKVSGCLPAFSVGQPSVQFPPKWQRKKHSHESHNTTRPQKLFSHPYGHQPTNQTRICLT